MSYKDILVFLDDGESNAERVKTAMAIASYHEARLTAVTLSTLVPEYLKLSDTTSVTRYSLEAAEQRIGNFLERSKAAGIPSASRVCKGKSETAARRLARFSRNFDLLILRQPNPKSRNYSIFNEVVQQVILLSGRPVFLMPYIGAHRIPCQKAMIAWDGSPSATRAVHDALPLLRAIDDVVILVVREGKKKSAKGEALTNDLASHLKRHGVKARVKVINSGTYDVPTVILNEVADNDIDILVMGGYGTPNLKQKIFGGVTRTLLSSMIIPVIMSH